MQLDGRCRARRGFASREALFDGLLKGYGEFLDRFSGSGRQEWKLGKTRSQSESPGEKLRQRPFGNSLLSSGQRSRLYQGQFSRKDAASFNKILSSIEGNTDTAVQSMSSIAKYFHPGADFSGTNYGLWADAIARHSQEGPAGQWRVTNDVNNLLRAGFLRFLQEYCDCPDVV